MDSVGKTSACERFIPLSSHYDKMNTLEQCIIWLQYNTLKQLWQWCVPLFLKASPCKLNAGLLLVQSKVYEHCNSPTGGNSDKQ